MHRGTLPALQRGRGRRAIGFLRGETTPIEQGAPCAAEADRPTLDVPVELQAVLQPETELNEDLRLANQLLKASSEVARCAKQQLSGKLDNLLHQRDRCTDRFELSEVVGADLL